MEKTPARPVKKNEKRNEERLRRGQLAVKVPEASTVAHVDQEVGNSLVKVPIRSGVA